MVSSQSRGWAKWTHQLCIGRFCQYGSLHLQSNLVPWTLYPPQSTNNTYEGQSRREPSRWQRIYNTPNQSWSCRTQVERACSIGGSKKITWFCIRISWTIAFSCMLFSKNWILSISICHPVTQKVPEPSLPWHACRSYVCSWYLAEAGFLVLYRHRPSG